MRTFTKWNDENKYEKSTQNQNHEWNNNEFTKFSELQVLVSMVAY